MNGLNLVYQGGIIKNKKLISGGGIEEFNLRDLGDDFLVLNQNSKNLIEPA